MKKKKLTIKADTSELHRVRKTVTEFIDGSLDRPDISKVVLAIDEAIANIIIHGYMRDSSGKIVIEMKCDDSDLSIVITDNAPPFNPLELNPPDIDEYLVSGKTGGLGVDITRRIMGVQYEKTGTGGNRLILVRPIKSSNP